MDVVGGVVMVVVVVPVGVSLLGKRASFRKKKAALNTPNNYLNGHRKQISIAITMTITTII